MRTTTTAFDTAAAADNVPLLMFVFLDFETGPVRVCNAAYDFTWNGYTWAGAGAIGAIQEIEEGAELQMYGVGLSLTGIPSNFISTALAENIKGRDVILWVAPLSDTYQILEDPVQAFSGRMDTMTIELGESAAVLLTAESRLADWDRPRMRRYTHEDQIQQYPDDRGFEYVAQMAEKKLQWGK